MTDLFVFKKVRLTLLIRFIQRADLMLTVNANPADIEPDYTKCRNVIIIIINAASISLCAFNLIHDTKPFPYYKY